MKVQARAQVLQRRYIRLQGYRTILVHGMACPRIMHAYLIRLLVRHASLRVLPGMATCPLRPIGRCETQNHPVLSLASIRSSCACTCKV